MKLLSDWPSGAVAQVLCSTVAIEVLVQPETPPKKSMACGQDVSVGQPNITLEIDGWLW
jgi:hypothetical protein